MNQVKKLQSINFLSRVDLEMLVDDIVGEEGVLDVQDCKNRNVIAWFLRYYHYIPFSLITELLRYKGSSSASEAVFTVMNNGELVTSLSRQYSDLLEQYRDLSGRYYDCSHNIFLDRGVDDEFEDALLYGASQACGVVDKHNKVSWYKATPKNSSLYNLCSILEFLSYDPANEEEALDYILNYYEIKSTE